MTPHSTTGISPAELLFGRKVQTKLPQLSVMEDTKEIREVRERHDKKKMSQKHYFDKGHRAREKVVKLGDHVLVKQNKTTTKPPYNPNPYTVADVHGNQLVLTREDGSCKIRDKNQVRVLKDHPANLTPSWECKSRPPVSNYMDFEIESDLHLNVSHNNSSHDEIAEHSENEADESDIEVAAGDQIQDALYDIDENEQARVNLRELQGKTPSGKNHGCTVYCKTSSLVLESH